MQVRRIVTGHSPEGKAVLLSDEVAPRTLEMNELPLQQAEIWATAGVPTLPVDGIDPTLAMRSLLPAAGDTRFRLLRFPSAPEVAAAIAAGIDWAAFGREYVAKAPGLAEAHEPDGSGMHRTDTVDYGIVLSGEIWLELDDGARTLMHAGDCVIQNGTRHGWKNEGEAPCVVAFIMIGARPG